MPSSSQRTSIVVPGSENGVASKVKRRTSTKPPATRKIEWRKGRLLGEGASSKVYVGLDGLSGTLMAGKEFSFSALKPEKAALAVANLKSEIAIMKGLSHRNVVRYIGADMLGGSGFCIFMEYVPGGSVRDLLDEFGPLPEPVAKKYVAQLLEGLAYLHEHGVVHRDVKGANVLVSVEGRVKLGDFGSAEAIANSLQDGESAMKGTARWIAPEVIRGESATPAADVWSVGCTMLEMLTGKLPFYHLKSSDGTRDLPGAGVMVKIADPNEPVPIPDDLEISPACMDFLECCLEKSPKFRRSARDLLQSSFLASSGGLHSPRYSIASLSNASSASRMMSPFGSTTQHHSLTGAGNTSEVFVGGGNPFMSSSPPHPSQRVPESSGDSMGEDHSRNNSTVSAILPLSHAQPPSGALLSSESGPSSGADSGVLSEAHHKHLMKRALQSCSGSLHASAEDEGRVTPSSVSASASPGTSIVQVNNASASAPIDVPDMDDRVLSAVAAAMSNTEPVGTSTLQIEVFDVAPSSPAGRHVWGSDSESTGEASVVFSDEAAGEEQAEGDARLRYALGIAALGLLLIAVIIAVLV